MSAKSNPAEDEYRDYIKSLESEKEPVMSIAIALSAGAFQVGKVISFTKKDIVTTADDDNFVYLKVVPALKDKLLEVFSEYKKTKNVPSLTSDLLGDEIAKKLDILSKKVMKEMKATKKGFIGK